MLALCLAGCVPALAQSVALTGIMGERALLVIDGAAPEIFSPGQTRMGVTLVSAGGEVAVVVIGGRNQSLRVGESPVSVAGRVAGAGGSRVVLQAGSGGHFFGTGQINGITMPFVVDTGASNVVLGVEQAERIGLDFRSGRRDLVSTANGNTLAYRVALSSIRIGEVEVFNVEATVVPSTIPVILLGNSFLGRFQIRQENSQMVLEKRY